MLIITTTIAVTNYHHQATIISSSPHTDHLQPPRTTFWPTYNYFTINHTHTHPNFTGIHHTILLQEVPKMANLYVQAVPPTDLNRNTEWFMYPGVWTTYILILFFAWLVVLSVSGCSPGMAWTTVNLCHALVYFLFHLFWFHFICFRFSF